MVEGSTYRSTKAIEEEMIQSNCKLVHVGIFLFFFSIGFLFLGGGSVALAEDANWPRHQIYSGARVNSAVAHDYNGDGTQEIIFSAGGEILILSGDGYETKRHLAKIPSKYALFKPQCIHCVLHDVDQDGDLDFVGSFVRGVFWLECPDEDMLSKSWRFHEITNQILGVHCIRSFNINGDGISEIIVNDFTKDQGPYSSSVCWLKPVFSKKEKVSWQIVALADGTANGGSHYFDFGDINNDGLIDFAMGAKGKPFTDGDYFAIYYSSKNPKSPWRRELLPRSGSQMGATHGAPVDVNGDGKMDVLATRGHGVGVLWFEGPDWKEHIIDDEISAPHSADFGDIDGDGDVDLVCVGNKSKLAAWYENDGKGNFSRHVLSRNQMSYDAMITDLDGDGDHDILVAGQHSQNVVWFENPQN